MKTLDNSRGTRANWQEPGKNQTRQNNNMYGTYNFERKQAPRLESVQMMWKMSTSHAKFDIVKNRPQTTDRRPPGPAGYDADLWLCREVPHEHEVDVV